jgi:prepilin-type N-terminal cleavage/methylation domain-containing protein
MKRARAGRRGYTMIEAMMALAILTIGATGIAGIQRATVVGNTNARNLATANSIALSWVERLRADAIKWNNPGGVPDLGDTNWLQGVSPVTPAGWTIPVAVPLSGISSAADVLGADIMPGDNITPQAYCTQLRLTMIYPTLIRAEIRVFWNRHNNAVSCLEPAAINADASFGALYGFVVVTTGLAQNSSVNYAPSPRRRERARSGVASRSSSCSSRWWRACSSHSRRSSCRRTHRGSSSTRPASRRRSSPSRSG